MGYMGILLNIIYTQSHILSTLGGLYILRAIGIAQGSGEYRARSGEANGEKRLEHKCKLGFYRDLSDKYHYCGYRFFV